MFSDPKVQLGLVCAALACLSIGLLVQRKVLFSMSDEAGRPTSRILLMLGIAFLMPNFLGTLLRAWSTGETFNMAATGIAFALLVFMFVDLGRRLFRKESSDGS